MLVPVDVWTMDSDPGYVPSSGYGEVRVLGRGDVANKFEEGEEALFDLATSSDAFYKMRPEQIHDPRTYSRKRGACNYRGTKGFFNVPPGAVAVQIEYYDVCTDDGPRRYAKILNSEDLQEEYRRLAAYYQRMAMG